MPTQKQIEVAAGIDQEIAGYMMAQRTYEACNAMALLQMQCDYYEPQGFALLKDAVSACRADLAASKLDTYDWGEHDTDRRNPRDAESSTATG